MLDIAGNKALSQSMLQAAGLPVPRFHEFSRHSMREAERFFDELGSPVVVKPSNGYAGRGVTTDIVDIRQLRAAAKQALVVSSRALVEKQIDGTSYRLLYLAGELIDVLERRAPTVIGNGRSRVKDLVAEENARRLSGTVTALSALTISDKRVANKVPDSNELYPVKRGTNQNSARDNSSVIGQEHTRYRELGHEIFNVLPIEFMGVDLIAEDICLDPDSNESGIHEINTTPALHHHQLIDDPASAVPVGELLIRYILARLSR
jgi:cyanophycin synthetase